MSASFFSVVKDYVGILLFICLPVILLSASLAIWLHYRQKKRTRLSNALNHGSRVDVSPSSITSREVISLSPLAIEDKIGLARACRKQLSSSRAKYLALKNEFTRTQTSITETINKPFENAGHMEHLNEKISAYEKQIADLQSKLEVLETVIPGQDEAFFLRQALHEKDNEISRLKVQFGSMGEDGSLVIAEKASTENGSAEEMTRAKQLKDEISGLDRKFNDKEYAKEAYAQSKLQAEFLQNQLALRVDNHNKAEQRIKELSALLEQASSRSNGSDGKIAYLNQQLESKQHEIKQLLLSANQKDAEMHRVKEEMQIKATKAAHLENLVAEIREQNSVLNISFAESQHTISILKDQLAEEEQHANQLEDKLLKNRQLFERIYRELESSVAMHERTASQQALVKPMY